MRTCGNPICKNYGKSWDTKHYSICPYCPKCGLCKYYKSCDKTHGEIIVVKYSGSVILEIS